jgi:MoaA/NifB/PqqE/SkfB family radical SAM enzyme
MPGWFYQQRLLPGRGSCHTTCQIGRRRHYLFHGRFLAKVHDGLRGENSLQHLEKSIKILNRAKKSLKSDTPLLAVSYLLTPETIKELPQAVLWCARRNIRALAGVQLTHPANKRQQSLQLFPCPEKAHRTTIRLAGLYALFKGIRLQLPPLSPSLTPICDKNPLSNLSISADGTVAPCVFLNAPTSSPIAWLGNGNQTSSFCLGNIGEQSLDAIWQSRTYTDFRGCFARRKKFTSRPWPGSAMTWTASSNWNGQEN